MRLFASLSQLLQVKRAAATVFFCFNFRYASNGNKWALYDGNGNSGIH